ncbi:ArsR/SmtB family transcription factor [Reichenbachiella agariperforans]|uniref:ArsR family transcriptional regulator n=1 Tax=Reichenbachiella agariperforans TaxID=156994 RepID=A0A1M6NFH2_REIAG|nr:metalloregulator ArsR/SmtB family transcription factor [Reichenbachiella agariperforans]MBU2915860.1 metalloregulator ArsR/SmtB family transcription factor [Reichenbachiella agariperforans]SHJ94440.1 ArsR family transcriptional regulator [Reichenbachiella agariperforans]
MKLKNFNLQYGSQIFKSFSDEARIRIMSLLFNHEELCISDIEHILDFTQTKTSRHITYLKNAGLLSYRKVDQWVFYEIKEEVMGMVAQIFKFLNKDAQLQKDDEIYQVLKSNRELAVNKIHKPL